MEIKLHAGQRKALKSKAKYVVVLAGTGSGKTFLGPVWIAKELERGGREVLVVSPTYLMFQRVVLPYVLNFFEGLGLLERYKMTERVMELRTGAKLYFGSADNPFSLEGVHVDAAWMDEAGQMKREAWAVVRRRVGVRNGRILITTTPYNLGWLKQEVYDEWKRGNRDFDVIQFPSIANPFYPKEEFERAQRTLPEWQFRMFYLGEFVRPEGLVYIDFMPSKHIVEPFPIPNSWVRIAGIDLGYNNPTAIIFLALDKDGRVFVYREYYERFKTAEEIINDFLEITQNENIDAVYVDPSEPAFIKAMRQRGILAKEAKNDVKEGISMVISLIKTDRLFVFRGCKNLLDEIENYRWKKVNDEIKDEPQKEYDHACDALRYALYTYFLKNKDILDEKIKEKLKGVKFYEE